MVKKKKTWSGIRTQIQITIESQSLLDGDPLSMFAKCMALNKDRSTFVSAFVSLQNDRKTERSRNLRLVGGGNNARPTSTTTSSQFVNTRGPTDQQTYTAKYSKAVCCSRTF